MTCQVNAKDLLDALKFVSGVVERRTTIPVLSTVLVDVAAGRMMIVGTDLDIECRTFIDATGLDMKFTVDPKLLAGLIRYHDGPVSFANDGSRIDITAGDMTAAIQDVIPTEDFPVMADKFTPSIPFDATVLKKALTPLLPAISTEETRYYLNGVYLHGVDGKLRMVATDGRRLAMYDTGMAWGTSGCILPRKSARLLHGALKTGVVQIASANGERHAKDKTVEEWTSHLHFKGDGWCITSKMIDGHYPDYMRVLKSPPEVTTSVTLSHAMLRRFPTTGTYAVKIDPEAGKVTMADHTGVTVSMPVSGRGNAFGMNLNYLLDCAKNASVIRLDGTGPGDPFRVVTDDPALTQVIMPMRV